METEATPGWDNSDTAVRELEKMPPVKPRVKSANTGAARAIRATKLKYPELTNSQIAKRVKCDPANVQRVLERFLGNSNTTQDLRDYQNQKADVWESVAMKAVMSIDDAKLSKSSAAQLMMVAGTAFDKSQLVRGQATQVNVTVLLDAVQAIREMRSRPAQVVDSTLESDIG